MVQAIYEKRKILATSRKTRLQVIASLDLVDSFWTTFESFEAEKFKSFEANFPEGFNLLSDLMSDLVRYHQLANLPDWKDTSEHVVAKMEKLIQRYFTMLIDLQKKDRSRSTSSAVSSSLGTSMTPHDWAGVWGSLLLLSYSKTFNERFGQERIVFERLAQQTHRWFESVVIIDNCPDCKGQLSFASGNYGKFCSRCCVVYAAAPLSKGKKFKWPYCSCTHQNGKSTYCSSCCYTYKYI